NRDLDGLGRRLANEQIVILAHKLDDRRIELVAAGPDRRIADDTRQRDDRDLRRAAANVDHHVSRWRLDRQTHSDRRSHWLSDHEYFLCTGTERRVANGALFYFCNTGWNAHDDARLHLEDMIFDDQRQEIPQHLF